MPLEPTHKIPLTSSPVTSSPTNNQHPHSLKDHRPPKLPKAINLRVSQVTSNQENKDTSNPASRPANSPRAVIPLRRELVEPILMSPRRARHGFG